MEWNEIVLEREQVPEVRGIGLIEMAWSIRQNRNCRVNGDVANHVLEIMHAIHTSSDTGRHIDLETTCLKPATVPQGLPWGTFDK